MKLLIIDFVFTKRFFILFWFFNDFNLELEIFLDIFLFLIVVEYFKFDTLFLEFVVEEGSIIFFIGDNKFLKLFSYKSLALVI